jgi:alkylation response protein AidB-like acyl-CoA dehydrogenase
LCVPKEYGGQGLTPAHQFAFNRELRGHDYPAEIQASTFIPAMALLLEFGTEEQKSQHIPAMLRGEEIWVQFLSEPGSGSDAASATTAAVRDGDGWILNGSKIWTTSGWYGDWAICLARTNGDVEKHRGLTVFAFPVATPGVEVHRIELVNGSSEFCQEYLTDVYVSDENRIGDVDAGWGVVTRWLYHERTISGGSPYVTGGGNRQNEGPHAPAAMVDIARRRATIAFDLCGPDAVAWTGQDEADSQSGLGYLVSQASCIGGGTTEMARNVISERLLGMPREDRADTGDFRTVPRGPRG